MNKVEKMLNRNNDFLGSDFQKAYIFLTDELLKKGMEYYVLFKKEKDKSGKKYPVEGVIFSIFLNILEMADGITISAKEGQFVSAILNIRSMFESLLHLEFILKNNTKKRAIAYAIEMLEKEIISRESFDFQTNQGKLTQKLIMKEDFVLDKELASKSNYNSNDDVLDINKTLKEYPFYKIKAKQEKYLEDYDIKKKWAKWYTYFSDTNPRSLEKLADELNHGYLYMLMFRKWSEVVHGTNRIRNLIVSGFIPSLRDPEHLADITGFSSTFLLMAIRLFTEYFDKNIQIKFFNYYAKNLRQTFLSINNTRINLEKITEL